MSPPATEPPATGTPGASGAGPGRWGSRVVSGLVLVLAWNLLWGEFSWGNLIGGALVAVAVLTFFPLPPVHVAGRVRPLPLLWFGWRFLVDLLVSSVQVAWLAVRPGPPPRTAVLAVPLRRDSDLHLTLTAIAVSLTPGSLIVEADRENATLYIHMLGLNDAADAPRYRRGVRGLEARLVRAIGPAGAVRRLDAEPVDAEEVPGR